jgi:hypothetical protein
VWLVGLPVTGWVGGGGGADPPDLEGTLLVGLPVTGWVGWVGAWPDPPDLEGTLLVGTPAPPAMVAISSRFSSSLDIASSATGQTSPQAARMGRNPVRFSDRMA